jgi:hypothetical protein
MKKGQGAKSRSTFLEAMRGQCAEGIVGFFIAKQHYRKAVAFEIDAFKKLVRLSAVQKGHLKKREAELVILDNEIAHTSMTKKRMTRGQRQALAVLARILRDFYASEEAKG